jgi:hypothetical protein
VADKDGSPARDVVPLRVARILGVGTLGVVALVALGVVLMLVSGRAPLQQPGAPLDVGRLGGDVAALRPEGFLWPALLLTIALPVGRLTLAVLGYARSTDRRLPLVAAAALGVLALSVALALATR